MIPIDTVDGTQTNVLLVLGPALLVGSFLVGVLAAARVNESRSLLTFILLGMLGGASIAVGGGSIANDDTKHAVTSWTEERYGIQIPENEIKNLIDKEIITLDDGTEIQLALPEKDADGYLLYKVTERDELPVK